MILLPIAVIFAILVWFYYLSDKEEWERQKNLFYIGKYGTVTQVISSTVEGKVWIDGTMVPQKCYCYKGIIEIGARVLVTEFDFRRGRCIVEQAGAEPAGI